MGDRKETRKKINMYQLQRFHEHPPIPFLKKIELLLKVYFYLTVPLAVPECFFLLDIVMAIFFILSYVGFFVWDQFFFQFNG